jgi:hypothetical protein
MDDQSLLKRIHERLDGERWDPFTDIEDIAAWLRESGRPIRSPEQARAEEVAAREALIEQIGASPVLQDQLNLTISALFEGQADQLRLEGVEAQLEQLDDWGYGLDDVRDQIGLKEEH